MDDSRGSSGVRGPGLTAGLPQVGARTGTLEFPRDKRPLLSEHRNRRLQLAALLLVASLALGGATLFFFVREGAAIGPGDYYGRVVDDQTTEAVADALVEAPALGLTAQTDAGGNFSFLNIPSGKTELVVSKAGYKNTTFAVFVIARGAGGASPSSPEVLRLPPGVGTATVDQVQERDVVRTACLIIIPVGLALTALGLLAVVNRSRYGHAILGGIGACLSIGFFVAPLLGLVVILLVVGAREEFRDRKPVFTVEPSVSLRGDEGEEGEEQGELSMEGGGTKETQTEGSSSAAIEERGGGSRP